MKPDTVPGDNWWGVFKSVWDNGPMIRVMYHEGPIAGEDPSDRILLLIKAQGVEEPDWYLMNIEDADSIIMGLDMARERAQADGVPANSTEAAAT